MQHLGVKIPIYIIEKSKELVASTGWYYSSLSGKREREREREREIERERGRERENSLIMRYVGSIKGKVLVP